MTSGVKPSRLALCLSFFVPGLGQFAQARWRAGAIFLSLFGVCFVTFSASAIGILRVFYSLGLSLNDGETKLPTVSLVIALFGALTVHSVGMIDTYLAHIRLSSKWREQRFSEPVQPIRNG